MRAALLPGLLLLGACAGRQGCEAMLANQGSLAVEQLYLTPEAGGPPGPDLLTAAPLPPGGRLALRFPAAGRTVLRAVWVNGRAGELPGIEACEIRQVTIRDTELRAE